MNTLTSTLSEDQAVDLSVSLEKKISAHEVPDVESKYKIIYESDEIDAVNEFVKDFYSKNIEHLAHVNRMKDLYHIAQHIQQKFGITPFSMHASDDMKLEYLEGVLKHPKYVECASKVPSICRKYVESQYLADGNPAALLQFALILIEDDLHELPQNMQMILQITHQDGEIEKLKAQITPPPSLEGEGILMKEFEDHCRDMPKLEGYLMQQLQVLVDAFQLAKKWSFNPNRGLIANISDGRLISEILARLIGHAILQHKTYQESPSIETAEATRIWKSLRFTMLRLDPLSGKGFDLSIPDYMSSDKDKIRLFYFYVHLLRKLLAKNSHVLSEKGKKGFAFNQELGGFAFPVASIRDLFENSNANNNANTNDYRDDNQNEEYDDDDDDDTISRSTVRSERSIRRSLDSDYDNNDDASRRSSISSSRPSQLSRNEDLKSRRSVESRASRTSAVGSSMTSKRASNASSRSSVSSAVSMQHKRASADNSSMRSSRKSADSFSSMKSERSSRKFT